MDTIKSKLLEALEMSKGIVTSACASIDCPRSTYYNWYKEDLEFKSAVDEIQDVAIDFVEGKLMEKVNGVQIREFVKGEEVIYDQAPSDTAIIFYLKTKGKKRGYIERMEVDNLTPIQVMNIDPLSQVDDTTANDSPSQNIVTP